MGRANKETKTFEIFNLCSEDNQPHIVVPQVVCVVELELIIIIVIITPISLISKRNQGQCGLECLRRLEPIK